MAPFEALYGRWCISPLCWETLGERSLVGPEWVQQTSEKVRENRKNILATQSHQKSYADVRSEIWNLQWVTKSFSGYHLLKELFDSVSPESLARDTLDRSLSWPRWATWLIAYNCRIPWQGYTRYFMSLCWGSSYGIWTIRSRWNQLLCIRIWLWSVVRCVCWTSERVLRKRSIKYVKVLWTNQSEREATWELEELMQQKYPELFVVGECCWFINLFFCRSDRSVRIRGRILLRGVECDTQFAKKRSGGYSFFIFFSFGWCAFGVWNFWEAFTSKTVECLVRSCRVSELGRGSQSGPLASPKP
jgi:hypothetical protein